MNYCAQLIGHTHPKLTQDLKDQVEKGTIYTMPHELSTEFAREIIKRFPVAKVRFTNSGTETTIHAIRLARGYTERDKIIKFAGAYHEVHNKFMASVHSIGNEDIGNRPVPISNGVPSGTLNSTLISTFNDKNKFIPYLKNSKER